MNSSVSNAGVVLLNNYINILFQRLGLVKDNQFINKQAQSDAVYYLQYVVTGNTHASEAVLMLNKVLCGIPMSQPLGKSPVISAEYHTLIDGLIKAIIAHWPVIGDSSVEGFRGNWLVRIGLLQEKETGWELTVEKRAYDLLINKSHFSFSVIKYPWMSKPLHVTWPY